MSSDAIFGHGGDLGSLQMAARAFALFFVTLVLIRIGGMRAFGRHSSFDTAIVITLGAVMSRAVVGASPMAGTIAASTTLVVVHRVVAMITVRSKFLERIVKGRAKPLYRDGALDLDAMNRAGISRADLEEAVRRRARQPALESVSEVDLESSGELSVIDHKR
jgi:uncharacterized membrane protein YcaP (DUF421 family)